MNRLIVLSLASVVAPLLNQDAKQVFIILLIALCFCV